MCLYKKINHPAKIMTEEGQAETHSRVLDEIAEVTRNNNIMKASEVGIYTSLHLSNPTNFKLFQNPKYITNPYTTDSSESIIVKNENDLYISENSDDGENLFNCQVELIEDQIDYHHTNEATESYLEHHLTTNNRNSCYEPIEQVPKIHLKTVDEINRKCIVSNYVDMIKKRRQEVNRRYYLKRKEQIEKLRKAKNGEESKADVKEKKKSIFAMKEIQEDVKQCITTYDDFNVTEYLIGNTIKETNTKEESYEVNQVPESNLNDHINQIKYDHTQMIEYELQPIKIEEETLETNIVSNEPSIYQLSYEVPHDYVLNYSIVEDDRDMTHDESAKICENYLKNSKRMRQEINRRYYLKRKKKLQMLKGVTDRVIIKNEAYLRRRERNRRYYLKKKGKLNEEINEGKEIEEISSLHLSLSINSGYHTISNLSDGNENDDQIRMTEIQYESDIGQTSENSLIYVNINNDKVRQAYLRRKERNRRYYLKRKGRFNQEKKENKELNESSNSQSSLQVYNQNSNSTCESTNCNYSGITKMQYESDNGKISNNTFDFMNMGNEIIDEVKHKIEIKPELDISYAQLTKNVIYHEPKEEWTKSQERIGEKHVECGFNFGANMSQDTVIPNYDTSSVESYMIEATRKRQERNRRYYLKNKEKRRKQRLEKCEKDTLN